MLVAPLSLPAEGLANEVVSAAIFYGVTAGAYGALPFVRRGDIAMVAMWLVLAVGVAPCVEGRELSAPHMFADMAGGADGRRADLSRPVPPARPGATRATSAAAKPTRPPTRSTGPRLLQSLQPADHGGFEQDSPTAPAVVGGFVAHRDRLAARRLNPRPGQPLGAGREAVVRV